MKKFIAFMEKHFLPVATKIGNQRHLIAIRDAFAYTMPLMIVGAFAVLINNLPIPGFQSFMNGIFSEKLGDSYVWTLLGGNIWNGTFAILSILISFLVAHNLAKTYDIDSISAGIVSLASFFAVGGAQGMDSAGLFIALIVGLISTEIFKRLSGVDKFNIKMPDGVPPAVSKSFAALLPAIFTVTIFAFVTMLLNAMHIENVVTAFYKAVQVPFMGMANSYPTALLIAFITPFLWFFGLHGANMIEPFMQTINAPAIQANAAALKAGKEIPYIVNKPFMDSFVNMGGTGVTIGLLIAIFIVGRKNKPYMSVASLATAPGIFNINEPLAFGLPLVLNPILFVPYILAPMVSVSIAYFATVSGFMPACTSMPPWVTPPIIGAVIATASWQGGVIAALNIVVAALIYAPFVYMSTAIEMRKSEAALNAA
ncbi:PTS sugar transporter subunit IIC [Companilactobacillus sp. HBUAS56275]|uniref:Permease IIC component n=1 Tax=Candidatus Companilactobacillus pullicola TaxID=2838523 RepID=A0A9D1ZN19_9LACO|nr:PTS sugar transporter subunit IIC [Candidatus Companilactobacillus pullicola]